MARKNYVNQNKGITLQPISSSGQVTRASRQKKSAVVEMCFYGTGCTRKGCIYRHPTNNDQSAVLANKSDAPCKPFLAGMCSFNALTCNKRHVSDPVERQSLIEKYKQTPCRHGLQCKQLDNGLCLYSHDISTSGSIESNFGMYPIGGFAVHSTYPANGQPNVTMQQTAGVGNAFQVAMPTGRWHPQWNYIQQPMMHNNMMMKSSNQIAQQEANALHIHPVMRTNVSSASSHYHTFQPLDTTASSTFASIKSDSNKTDNNNNDSDITTKQKSFNVNATEFVPTWR